METPISFEGIDSLMAELVSLRQQVAASASAAEEPKQKSDKKAFKLPALRTAEETEEYWKGRVRFNLMENCIQIRQRDGNRWVSQDAKSIGGLYLELSKHIDESADKTAVMDTIHGMAMKTEFNPLVEYFEGLRDAEPDEYKFNNLATWAFGENMKSPHADEILKYFLVAAVARTFEPGAYYRFCPILMGEREIGKSFMATLAPFDLGNTTEPQGNKYTTDQVLVAAKQSLILELGEADAFCQTVPTSVIKNFISVSSSMTPIKHKNAEKFIRTWVIFGTSNKANFIPSDLRRRFLPINLFHLKQGEFWLGDPDKLFDARDGIWAAAVQEYFENWVGKPIKYREELLDDIDAFTDDFVSESRWYESCCEQLDFSNRIFLSRQQVRQAITGGSQFEITDDQINGFMQKHNWCMRRVRLTKDGEQQRLFVHTRSNQYANYQEAYKAEEKYRAGVLKDTFEAGF